MKPVAVLGMGVIALTAGAFISAGAADRQRASYFEASVAGGLSARPTGEVAFGVAGHTGSGIATFTITLEGEASSGAILFTALDGRMPAPGRYELGEAAGTGFRAMYVAGSAERPIGLYRAERGTLEITASSPEHISGRFSFTGAGFRASDPTDEGSEVKVDGAFTSTRAPAARPAQP